MEAWLSESFAEYSCALYVQALMGEKRFQQKMTEWKKETRQGDPVAPVALAAIISGDNAGKYRTQLLYNKGPMVVHMIRTQMGNDNFLKAMQAILTKYKARASPRRFSPGSWRSSPATTGTTFSTSGSGEWGYPKSTTSGR